MRIPLLLMTFTTLAACGPRVSGEVAQACVASDRRAANSTLCSCVQSVASQTLSRSDQARLVTFFENPETANDIKINDSRSADAFWERYRAFTRQAEQSCR